MLGRFYGRKPKRIQPIHLKDALAAAMRHEKRELPYGDYAPNFYKVSLNPADLRRWMALKTRVIDQLARHLEQEIRGEGYRLEADLFIEIEACPTVASGRLQIVALFQEPKPQYKPALLIPMISHEDGVLWGARNHYQEALDSKATEEREGTVIVEKTPAAAASQPVRPPINLANIRVLAGEDQGLQFVVDRLPLVVGRIGKGADIALHDKRRHISRQQIEINRDNDGCFLLTDLRCRTDLQVYVNGEQAEPTLPLYSGDRIRLGSAQDAIAEMEFTVL